MTNKMRYYLVDSPCGQHVMQNSEILPKGATLRCKRLSDSGSMHGHLVVVVKKLRKTEEI